LLVLREMVQHVAHLVEPAALDQCLFSKDQLNGFAQGLGAIDNNEHPAFAIQTAADQVL